MTIQLNPRARGLLGVKADLPDANAQLDELKGTFADFIEANDKRLDDIEKGREDYVQNEKVDKINASMDEICASVDATNEALAALQIGGVGHETNPAKAEHAVAFDKWFRKGTEAGLADLEVKAALATDSDPDGGFTVPEEMSNTITRVLTTVSAMRNIAQVITIGTSSFTKLAQSSGVGSGWVGQREARPATSTPTLHKLDFPAMELYAMPPATQGMLDDSFLDVAAWLADEVAIKFAEDEGTAFISGTGVEEPRGITGYTNIADASWTWGNIGFTVTGVAADINDGSNNGVDAIIDLTYALKQGYRPNARFIMNRTLAGKVRKLKTLGGEANYLWQPPVQVGEPATILGYPLSDDDNMANVAANAYPIAFGDFRRGYLIVDRVGIRVLRDPFTDKPNVLFYTTKRVGGGVQNFEAYKLLKCST